MKFVESTLLPGERIVCEGHPSLWVMGPRITFSLLLMIWGVIIGTMGTSPIAAVVFFVAGLLLFGASLLIWWTTEVALTNKRLVATFGVFKQRTVEQSLLEVDSVRIEQSLAGRIFDYGSLVVADAEEAEATIPSVAHPTEFRRMVLIAQAAEKPVPLRLVA